MLHNTAWHNTTVLQLWYTNSAHNYISLFHYTKLHYCTILYTCVTKVISSKLKGSPELYAKKRQQKGEIERTPPLEPGSNRNRLFLHVTPLTRRYQYARVFTINKSGRFSIKFFSLFSQLISCLHSCAKIYDSSTNGCVKLLLQG